MILLDKKYYTEAEKIKSLFKETYGKDKIDSETGAYDPMDLLAFCVFFLEKIKEKK